MKSTLLKTLLFCVLFTNTFALTVNTTNAGRLTGITLDQYSTFFGIKYAEAERFAAPTAVSFATGTERDATKMGYSCPQSCKGELPRFVCPETEQNEDCLLLNVFTPARTAEDTASKRPTMVYIHGGAFQTGSISSWAYSPEYYTAKFDVCVVTLQYRLGVLGWAATSKNPSITANNGFRDQRLALKWVQTNVDAFGCDATNVTLFGESAGAASVGLHQSYGAGTPPLYHRVIMQSNPWALPFKTVQGTDSYFKKYAKRVGCDMGDIVCLRKTPVSKVLVAQKKARPLIPKRALDLFLDWTPAIDGEILSAQPFDLYRSNHVKTPMRTLFGYDRDEAVLFVYKVETSSLSYVKLGLYLTGLFGLREGAVEKLYSVSIWHDHRPVLSRILTDFLFRCPVSAIGDAISAPAVGPYIYHFNASLRYDGIWPPFDFCDYPMSCHGEELAYVFNPAYPARVPINESTLFNKDELSLMQLMTSMWSNYARTNQPSLSWQPWSKAAQNFIDFEVGTSHYKSWTATPFCDFWSNYYKKAWPLISRGEQLSEAQQDEMEALIDSMVGTAATNNEKNQ